MKKKGIIIAVICIIAAAATVFAVMKLAKGKADDASDEELVYTELVSTFMGGEISGENRYMGIVESQEVKNVDKSADKKVKDILVSEGDIVEEGDTLFTYDTEDMTLTLRQLELELTSIYNNISNANSEIATLSKARDEADAEDKIQYNAQIQSLQAQVSQLNYDASTKQLEIDRQKTAIENNEVFAPMSGIIKEINKDAQGPSDQTNPYDYYEGGTQNEKHFITIMAIGDYRIKATADEMNVRSMSEGQPMIIRSRIDDTQTWTGTISKIDLEHPESNNNNDMYYDGSMGETTTKYPFYVALDSASDLMLGQHVYVELDYGQGEVKDGVYIYEFYIMQENDKAYVWLENSKGRVEKHEVTLGEYDEYNMQYEIVSGLTKDDYIAYPEDRIKEGMKATHNYEDVMEYIDDGFEEGIDDVEMTLNLPEGYYFDENYNLLDPDGNIVEEYYFDENNNLVLGPYPEEEMNFDDGSTDGDVMPLDEEGMPMDEDSQDVEQPVAIPVGSTTFVEGGIAS